LEVDFERCEDKGEKSAPMFIPSSNNHKEEKAIKSTKAHYSSNLKPSFNPKIGVKKETPKLREEAFVCMFCGRAGHLDEFCFHRKRIEKRRIEYARNSYRNEFFDFPPRSYSRASPCTSSHAMSHFSHGPSHLISLMDLTIAHMVLVHERTGLCLDAFIMAYILIVMNVSRVGMVFLLERFTLTLSLDT
jgi:hypothetical protein